MERVVIWMYINAVVTVLCYSNSYDMIFGTIFKIKHNFLILYFFVYYYYFLIIKLKVYTASGSAHSPPPLKNSERAPETYKSSTHWMQQLLIA